MIELVPAIVTVMIFIIVTLFFALMVQTARVKDLKENLKYEKAKHFKRPNPPPRAPSSTRDYGLERRTIGPPIQSVTISGVSDTPATPPPGYVWVLSPVVNGDSK